MKETKLNTMTKLFEGSEIRSVWNNDEEDYYFSVVDVIGALTDSPNPRNYWNMLKKRLIEEENSELYTNCVQLKLKSRKDGKSYLTDTLNTEGIFRLIESVPSPKAEPFKLWLAKLGRKEVDNIFDPSKGINKMVDYYLEKGYTLDWIELRIKAIINRKKLTETWKENGITEDYEFAILTNEIYKTWSGMTAKEYKEFKGLRKESLRDNMDNIEVILTDLGEEATKRLAKKQRPQGLDENKEVAKVGGNVAKIARDELEKQLDESVVTDNNYLTYEYEDNKKELLK